MSGANSNRPLGEPAKSLIGPLEELYLVAFLSDSDEDQRKIEKALRAWADKWLMQFETTDAIDQQALTQMTPDEQRDYQREILQKAKQKLGEALAVSATNYREGPLNDINTIRSGNAPTINYRHYSMMGIRRWEK